MNLSKIENQMLVAGNWHEYKDKIYLPDEIQLKIDSYLKDYDDMILTNKEMYNQILDVLNKHYSN